MYRYILEDTRQIPPFNEPASRLNIGTIPLIIHQENLFAEYFKSVELGNLFRSKDQIRHINPGEAIVYRDSLWFDREFLDYFMRRARSTKRACRAAIPADDKAYATYTLPLTRDIERGFDADHNPIYLLDLWYFPNGYTDEIVPVVVPSGYKEKGFYSVPDFMAQDRGDLTHYLPARAVLSIESWVHVYYASVIFGVFTRGSRFEEHIKTHNFTALKLLWRGIIEQKQVLTTSEVVKVGKNTVIDPSAVINGPTTIGDNCFIGPGAVIDNSSIGDNVNISQGCQVMLSTVGNNSFLPFRASLFMTVIMDNCILAQNTCLQMCVIGRNTFIGAGSTFTDFNLIGEMDSGGHVVPRPIKAANIYGELENVGQVVLGGAVGHNCRIGSGMVVFPGRMIESDVILVASPSRRVLSRNVTYEESDHHQLEIVGTVHRRQYPRHDEKEEAGETTWNTW
jgi:UDP-N-acetylglucosamine diphosphorylase / glucose-1-phosphate thymidylyltransferase / UDP-N-acetylgalactosamine diphosphorylase / glucosamine-1-phosphate N-acetyltransferase / galactosamine-1-phosphate N-acetyltransferase